MKFKLFIASVLFFLGFNPNKEIFADNNELIGCGYLPKKGKVAYYDGQNAYLFPCNSKIWNKVQNKLLKH